MKKLRMISIFFIAIILASITITPVSQVFALNDFYSSNDILFYDSNANGCPRSTIIDGSNVTIIGDSITEGSKTQILNKLPKADIYSKVSRHFATGIDMLRGDKASVDDPSVTSREILIFALGTNDSGLTATNISELVSLVGSGKTIVLMTDYTSLNSNSTYASNNSIVKEASKKYNNVFVADWAGAVTANPGQYIGSDNIHPTVNGQKLFADTLYNAIPNKADTGGGSIDTTENLTTILNYMTGKGLSLAAAAGIAGNLFQESGYNPAIIEGGAIAPDNYVPVNGVGFGLAQWTFTSRQQPLFDFAASQGKKITDLGMQLDYLWQELNTKYTTVLRNLNSIKSDNSFNTTSASMVAAIIFHGRTDLIVSGATREITDVINSSMGFGGGFEGSGDTAQMLIDNRGKRAESIYNTYRQTIADGTGVVGIDTAVAGSLVNSSGCATTAGDASWPANVDAYNKGWKLKDNTDYSNVPCATGTVDNSTYTHPTRGYIIRTCTTPLGTNPSPVGTISSLMSQKVLSMITSASQSGITLTGSSWRSYEAQIASRMRIINGKQNCPDIYTSPSSSCAIPTAIPGSSQHESGLAIDFATIGRVGSGPEWDWLVANAASFGFYNFSGEGWHWSMSGS